MMVDFKFFGLLYNHFGSCLVCGFKFKYHHKMRHKTNNRRYMLHNSGCVLCKYGPICKQQCFGRVSYNNAPMANNYKSSPSRAEKATLLGIIHVLGG